MFKETTTYYLFGLLLVLSLMLSVNLQAVEISKAKYAELTGMSSDNRSAAAAAFRLLYEQSVQPRFATVGSISGCTANYLGHDDNMAYILTAAHCVSGTRDEPAVFNVNRTFRTLDGRVIASGTGQAHVVAYNGYNADVAVLALPFRSAPVDFAGNPLAGAVLEDITPHTEFTSKYRFDYAGHGVWAIAGSRVGAGRAYGSLQFAGKSAEGHLGFTRNEQALDHGWASSKSGDSGSSVWFSNGLRYAVAGVHSVGGGTWSGSAAIYRYIDFIRNIYPEVRLASQLHTVTAEQPMQTLAPETEATGPVFYTATEGVGGPAEGHWAFPSGLSRIVVQLTNEADDSSYPVTLRVRRASGCGWTRMNNAAFCGNSPARGELQVEYVASDNPRLPAGRYRGEFELAAHYWQSMQQFATVPVFTDIAVAIAAENGAPGQDAADAVLAADAPARTAPLDAEIRGSVYYTTVGVPSGHWRYRLNAYSVLTVPVVNEADSKEYRLRVRAQRLSSCGRVMMNNAIICGAAAGQGALEVRYLPSDNRSLPDGLYTGQLKVQANGWYNRSFQRELNIDIAVQRGAQPTAGVSFVSDDEVLAHHANLPAGKPLQLFAPEVEKPGYRLMGWFPALPEIMPTTDISSQAVWRAEHYVLGFETAGGSTITGRTLNAGDSIVLPAPPTRAGHNFIGWSHNRGPIDHIPQVMPTSNVVLRAHYEMADDSQTEQ